MGNGTSQRNSRILPEGSMNIEKTMRYHEDACYKKENYEGHLSCLS